MGEPSLQMLAAPDFSPDKYVTDLSLRCEGGPELIRLKKKIHSLFEETSDNLKRNVYQNYTQFIDTAKEISHLEGEMYQLSHLLSEQRTLLQDLYNTSILGDDTSVVVVESNQENSEEKEEEIRRQKLATIYEKVEGCSNLPNVPNRKILHEGFLSELDPLENTPLRSVFAFLFSDGLMIAISNSNTVHRNMRFTYENLYDLGTLAVVNVKDIYNKQYAFKLLAFPDTRVFQCKSNTSKMDWLKKIDLAKRARLSQEHTKRESVEKSPSRAVSIDSPSIQSFDMQDEEAEPHPDWLLDIGEELDVFIAQRHFEQTIALLQKGREYIEAFGKGGRTLDHNLQEIQRKINQKYQTLTDVLTKELEVNPDKSLQGGLRAARRAVRLLNQLERSTQACDLFLKFCSSMLKMQCKRVKREGSISIYVRNFSSTVFTNMCNMTEEFLRAFPNSPSCAAAYIVWASKEIQVFATHFIKQVFVPQTPFSTITECVVQSVTQCERLYAYGVDLSYQLHGALRTPLSKALTEARDKLIDAIKLRSQEEKWRPLNLRSKTGLTRYLQEYADCGIALEEYVKDDCWLQLTQNSMSFTKLYLNFLDDCLKLKGSNLLYTIDETLVQVFEAQIRYFDATLKVEANPEQRQFITKNVSYLLNVVLPHALEKYNEVNGFPFTKLSKLQTDFKALSKGVTPSSRNITKYSSTEYL